MSSRAKKKRLAKIEREISDEIYKNFLDGCILTTNKIIEDLSKVKIQEGNNDIVRIEEHN